MLRQTFEDILHDLGCAKKHNIHSHHIHLVICPFCGAQYTRNLYTSRSRCVLLKFRIAGEDIWACFTRRECTKCHKYAFYRILATIKCASCDEEIRVSQPIFGRDHSSGQARTPVGCNAIGSASEHAKLDLPQ